MFCSSSFTFISSFVISPLVKTLVFIEPLMKFSEVITMSMHAEKAMSTCIRQLEVNACKRKVKAFLTRCQALGLESIPVYRQSARSYPTSGRLPLLSARPAVTFPATEHYSPLAGTMLYCLVTEAHRCEQLAKGCYAALAPSRN